MIFALADPGATNSTLSTLGVPGLVFIVLVSWGVIGFLYRQLEKARDKVDNIQEQRVIDSKETRDKIREPLEKQALLSEKMYDLLLQSIQKGK